MRPAAQHVAADPLGLLLCLVRTVLDVAVTLDDHFLCPLCGAILAGVEKTALHAAAEHPDAAELTMLNLDTAPLPPLAQPY